MLALVLTLVFAFDILLAVLAARSEPDAPVRKFVLIVFGLQLFTGVAGGMIGMLRFI